MEQGTVAKRLFPHDGDDVQRSLLYFSNLESLRQFPRQTADNQSPDIELGETWQKVTLSLMSHLNSSSQLNSLSQLNQSSEHIVL